jgi:micrococcal nuclease
LYRVNVADVARSRDADTRRMLPARVTRVVDGDTVIVAIADPPAGLGPVERIRLLGIDTPEMRRPGGGGPERFAVPAAAHARARLLGKDVLLAFDWDLRDRYGRLLAYVYLPDGSCFDADMVRQGFAHAYTRFPFQFLEEFRALERRAREQRKGLWK